MTAVQADSTFYGVGVGKRIRVNIQLGLQLI